MPLVNYINECSTSVLQHHLIFYSLKELKRQMETFYSARVLASGRVETIGSGSGCVHSAGGVDQE